jgi:hypothetical protein
VTLAAKLLKEILCFAKYDFTAVNIDNHVVSVVRFRVNNISSCIVLFFIKIPHICHQRALLFALESASNSMENDEF